LVVRVDVDEIMIQRSDGIFVDEYGAADRRGEVPGEDVVGEFEDASFVNDGDAATQP